MTIRCRNVAPLQAVAGHNTLTGQNTLCFNDHSEKRACLKNCETSAAGRMRPAGRSLATPGLDYFCLYKIFRNLNCWSDYLFE